MSQIKIEIIEGAPLKNFEKPLEVEMSNHLRHFEKELLKVRTGRAHTSLIEEVKVECYGTVMTLKELASLSAPEANMLIAQPWDQNVIADIEKALLTSDLGLTPQNDGTIIRIMLPKISSSRRDELIKMLHKKAEEARISVRNIRKEIQNIVRDNEKGKKISEDYAKKLQDSLQKVTDKVIESIDNLCIKKEEEIRII